MPMVQLESVHKVYRGKQAEVSALAGVSLNVEAGEFLAVRGPSGCGKTTLLLTVGALLLPSAGKVLIDGCDPFSLSPNGRARWRSQTVGFVFQQFHLVPYLDVLDNVMAASLPCRVPNASERAHELLHRLGLTDRLHHVPSELSTGERQRVALVRALLNQPKILLADEPTGNLDATNSQVVLEHLTAFAEGGGAVLLVTHDADAAAQAHRIVEMKDGALIDHAYSMV